MMKMTFTSTFHRDMFHFEVVFLETRSFLLTYIHYEKVQPAPVVGEILLEAIGDPLEEHFQHKDVGKYLVGSL